MAQWWEHSSPANVTRVCHPDPGPNVGWVFWFSTLNREIFSGNSVFPSPQKPAFDLICVNFSLQCPQLALRARTTRHLNKLPFLSVWKRCGKAWIFQGFLALIFFPRSGSSRYYVSTVKKKKNLRGSLTLNFVSIPSYNAWLSCFHVWTLYI